MSIFSSEGTVAFLWSELLGLHAGPEPSRDRIQLMFCHSVVEELEKAAMAMPFLLPLLFEDLGCEDFVVFAFGGIEKATVKEIGLPIRRK